MELRTKDLGICWSFQKGRYNDVIDALHRARTTTLILEPSTNSKASAEFDASWALRLFARWCAFGVQSLWSAPTPVRDYLSTGRESHTARAHAERISSKLEHGEAKSAAESAMWAASDPLPQAAWKAMLYAEEAQPHYGHRSPRRGHRRALTRLLLWAGCAGGHLHPEHTKLPAEQAAWLAVASDEVQAGLRSAREVPPSILSFEAPHQPEG